MGNISCSYEAGGGGVFSEKKNKFQFENSVKLIVREFYSIHKLFGTFPFI